MLQLLPDELLEAIACSWLDVEDVFSVLLTCKTLRNAVNVEVVWTTLWRREFVGVGVGGGLPLVQLVQTAGEGAGNDDGEEEDVREDGAQIRLAVVAKLGELAGVLRDVDSTRLAEFISTNILDEDLLAFPIRVLRSLDTRSGAHMAQNDSLLVRGVLYVLQAAAERNMTRVFDELHRQPPAVVDRNMIAHASTRYGGWFRATPLTTAAYHGNLDIVRKLVVDFEVDVMAREGRYHQTPLHVACARDHLHIVDFLLAHGADPDAIDRDGWPPRLLVRHHAPHAQQIIARLQSAGND